jgi:hypothetical protein
MRTTLARCLTTHLLLAASLVASGCIDTESKCQGAYEQAYRAAYDEASARAYAPAFAASRADTEPAAYEAQRERLVASRAYSYDPSWLTLAAAAGLVLGFAMQFLAFYLARRMPAYADSLDRQILGLAQPRFALPSTHASSLMGVALLCACLAATACGDGGAARCGKEGEAAGRIAGETEGREAGQRDGLRRGMEEGTLRATADAQAGRLPEIYVMPLLFAAALGIATGFWAQRRVVTSLKEGVQVPVVLLAIAVPGITRSRTFRAWRAEHSTEVERRLRAIGGAPQHRRSLPPPVIDVANRPPVGS